MQRRWDVGRSALALAVASLATVGAYSATQDQALAGGHVIALLLGGEAALAFGFAALPSGGAWSYSRRAAAVFTAALLALPTAPVLLLSFARPACACYGLEAVPIMGVLPSTWAQLALVAVPLGLALAAVATRPRSGFNSPSGLPDAQRGAPGA